MKILPLVLTFAFLALSCLAEERPQPICDDGYPPVAEDGGPVCLGDADDDKGSGGHAIDAQIYKDGKLL